jgi:hypothetical protein
VILAVGALLVVPLTGWGVFLCGIVLAVLLGYKLTLRWMGENAAMAVVVED